MGSVEDSAPVCSLQELYFRYLTTFTFSVPDSSDDTGRAGCSSLWFTLPFREARHPQHPVHATRGKVCAWKDALGKFGTDLSFSARKSRAWGE